MNDRNAARMPYRVTYNQDCSDLFAALSKGKRRITPADVDRMVDMLRPGVNTIVFRSDGSPVNVLAVLARIGK